MIIIPHTTDERAACDVGTVKNLTNKCERPAVPNINVKQSDSKSIGSLYKLPGCKNLLPSNFISAKSPKREDKLKLKITAIKSNIIIMAPINKTALIICTQLVASIPPSDTYIIISIPTIINDIS